MSRRAAVLLLLVVGGVGTGSASPQFAPRLGAVPAQQPVQNNHLSQQIPGVAIAAGSDRGQALGRKLLGDLAVGARGPGALGRRLVQLASPWLQQWTAPTTGWTQYQTAEYTTPAVTTFYSPSVMNYYPSMSTGTTYVPISSLTNQPLQQTYIQQQVVEQQVVEGTTTDWLPSTVQQPAGGSEAGVPGSSERRGRPAVQRQQRQKQQQEQQQQQPTTPLKPTLPSFATSAAAAATQAKPAASFVPAVQSQAATAVTTATDTRSPSTPATQPAAGPAPTNTPSTTNAAATAVNAAATTSTANPPGTPAVRSQRKRPVPAATPAQTAAQNAAASVGPPAAAAAAAAGVAAAAAAATAAPAPQQQLRSPRKTNGAATDNQRQQRKQQEGLAQQQQQLDVTQPAGATSAPETPAAPADQQQQPMPQEPPAVQLQPEPLPAQQPAPEKPAEPGEPEKYCIPWKFGEHFRVLAAGDSITQGSVPSQNRNWPYAIRLTSLLKEKVGPFARAFDAGLGGGGIFMTGFNNPTTFPPFINSYLSQGSWNAVVIMIGINDLLRGGKPAADIMGGLTPIVNDVLDKGLPLILIPPLAAPGFVEQNDGKEAERKKLAGLYKDLAAQRAAATNGVGPQIYVLDLQSGPLEFYGMSQADRSKYLDDGLHLTTTGYDALGDYIFQELSSHMCAK